MESKTLFIFNPEHDLALAVGKGAYTPPAEVVKLRNELTLLPAIYAGNSDFILLPDDVDINEINHLPFSKEVRDKGIITIHAKEIERISTQISFVKPWGWNFVIKNHLLSNGMPAELLPSEEEIDNIRNLSHRRTVIPFRSTLFSMLGWQEKFKVRELFSLQEVEDFLNEFSPVFFKAPWSSSGRGIVVSDHISRKGLMEWAHGTIRKQGSVIAEPAWDKKFDFATEWSIDSKGASFLGLSVFNTSSRGKYHGNIKDSQASLLKMIRKEVPKFNSDIIEAQKEAIDKHITPYYKGPLGIDMLGDADGDINLCVEINLRLTMGLIEIIKI